MKLRFLTKNVECPLLCQDCEKTFGVRIPVSLMKNSSAWCKRCGSSEVECGSIRTVWTFTTRHKQWTLSIRTTASSPASSPTPATATTSSCTRSSEAAAAGRQAARAFMASDAGSALRRMFDAARAFAAAPPPVIALPDRDIEERRARRSGCIEGTLPPSIRTIPHSTPRRVERACGGNPVSAANP